MKPKVLLTNRLPEPVMEALEKETVLTAPTEAARFSEEAIREKLPGHEILFCSINNRVDRDLLERGVASGLKGVCNFGVGFNHIDIAAARELGLPVTNTPGVLTDATADIAFGLLLAAARRFYEGEQLVRRGEWQGWSPLQLLGGDLRDATLGLLGFGRIGRAMAERARGFGLKLIYWNRTRLADEEEKALGLRYVERDGLFQESDFLSLHVAYTPETHHLVDARTIGLMRPHSVIINTARGAIIDEKALVEALKAERIGGAGLDVFEREPQLEEGLRELPNCILLPHLGSATRGTRVRMGMMAMEDVLRVFRGEVPLNSVY